MANYTAADVKKLRELTGAGMMDCKKALDEADGNVDKAVEALRIKGQKGVAKREGRSAENGAVVSLIADDNTSGVLRRAEVRDGLRRQGREVPGRRQRDRRARRRDLPGRHRGAARLRDRGRQDRPGVRRRGQRQPRREDRPGPLRAVRRRLRRRVHAPHHARPAPADRCPRRAGQGRTPRSPRTSRSTSPPSRRSTSPVRTSRPRSSRPSVASPRRPPAPRASPRPPCRRSSRVASTASSRTPRSSASRTR